MSRNIAKERFGSGCCDGRTSNRGGSFELRMMDGIGIEMVKTFSRPLSQQQIQTELDPPGNRDSISSKKMR